MLDVWLLPAIAILAVGFAGLYLVVRFTGGNGERTKGRILVHNPDRETEPPDY